ncbi:aryl-sulfate sulfotransferase [Pedobacter gandavensis]|uniref:Aryl sulfotransferase n=1 Tax=Pedobacter gandavensis TaxID=2679963 RepID=A0ABR6F3Y0_9SPHI|nr:aryl-sulfate sulfotransferase [Pedobacter gandavensis]MBB2151724.1 aryl sulfotransferase [Pedobacter gandavensis]
MIGKRVFFGLKTGLLGFAFLFFIACKKDKLELPAAGIEFQNSLENMVNHGVLLQSYVKENENYVFHFETGDISVPQALLLNIQEQPDLWKTVVNFKDKTSFSLLSKGNSLDFIVKDKELNPSGYNPLSATVEVLLPGRGRVEVIVEGKPGTTGTIKHLLTASNPRQVIPVLGLYADYNNQVDLVFTDMEGKERGRTHIQIKTAALDVKAFPTFQTIVAQKDKMEPGFNLVSYPGESELDVSCPYMLDAEGEVRWILLLKASPKLQRFAASIGLKRMKNGNFLSGDGQGSRIVEIDMFGNLVKEWDLLKLGYTFHHEVTEAANGNYLITVSKSAARLRNGKPRINDHIIELNPLSGVVEKEWDLANMLDSSRYDHGADQAGINYSQTAGNWAHNNSIAAMGNDFLATVRFQGIMSFTRGGAVKWVISPHKGWSSGYQQLLLSPVDGQGKLITDEKVISGETAHPDFDWSWGMHTPVLMPNGNILVFDNGYNRHFKDQTLGSSGGYSRIVEYKVDEAKKTVQQVWAYGESRGANGFSAALSGVQYLSQTGHVMFCPGMGVKTNKGLGGRIVELDPKTKEVIYDLEITAPSVSAFHRVTRMSIYPDNM